MLRNTFLFALILQSFSLFAQSNPVPLVYQPLVPASIAPGHAALTLTVNGAGFSTNAIVRWNGSPRPTTFVSAAQLQAAISTKDVATASTALVTVQNPGVTPSNTVFFQIRQSSKTVTGVPQPSRGADLFASTTDLKGDGNADVLLLQSGDCSDEIDGTLREALGNGRGQFKLLPAQQFNWCAISNPIYGDFNGDGKPDFAISSGFGFASDPEAFVNNGDGTFSMSDTIPTSFGGSNAFVMGGPADMNGDGKLDLLVAELSEQSFQVALGNGDGTFNASAPTVGIPSGGASSVAIGDFNRDGRLDAAFIDHAGFIDIYLGDGHGSFQPGGSFQTSFGGTLIVTADVNGDGILDLITDGVSVMLGNGDGTFTNGGGQKVAGNSFAYQALVADFNGDGKLDLAIGSNPFWLLLGNGDGTFQNPLMFSGKGPFSGPAVADFNNDGKLDLVDGELFLQQ